MNSQPNENDKDNEIEGLDVDEDTSWADYPIDTMLIRNEPRTVHEVLRRIDQGVFQMDPDFQRDFIWPDDKQSKLIESVLMRIPLPVFYLAENSVGKMVVVDGLQRLSTFQRFVKNNHRLRLPEHDELHGKFFSDLSPKLQNRVEDCPLILYIIDAKVPPKALLDIFERVNSGVPLTRQQMRNCLFMGGATKFLKDESKTDIFLTATGRSLRSDTMRDREMVNRFCAFQLLPLVSYRGDMDAFLASALEKMNRLSPQELENLSIEFRAGLRNNLIIFGRHAFRKYYSDEAARSVFNASIWDVMSTSLSKVPESIVEAKKEKIKTRFADLLIDEDFHASVTLGTSQVNRVRDRFAYVNNLVAEILNA
ncbi:MAG: DUF262 domain-containing protein [Alphaproteobacteria bacterium]|nr:DUF262 domain-containing protein [Alphaproteobacteria bacterium]